jgi:Fe-Mn family superoxide dismutase
METFTQKTFNLKNLKNISQKNIEEHLKLYEGYVKNTNLILEKINQLNKDPIDNAYLINEMHRRFSFEFNGMRNHEYYFNSLENGPKSLAENSELKKAIIKDFNSFEEWFIKFKNLALVRGIGWIMLSYDKKTNRLLNHWVDEQHLGHLMSTKPIICLDMWEHAYLTDYSPAEKNKYVEAFFENLNWQEIEKNFKEALK